MTASSFPSVALPPKPNVAVLGAGSWGLTLCKLLAHAERSIVLWGRDEARLAQWQSNRSIHFPLELTLPEPLALTANLSEAITDADVVLMVVTCKATRSVAEAMVASGVLKPTAVVVNASKGLEFPSLKRMSQVLAEVLPPEQAQATLSGPTLAKELLAGLPTACSVASTNREVAAWLQQSLSCNQRFRLYSHTDVAGVELGGALKNVFAIASGFMGAHQLGDNAKAALITRGLAELARFSLLHGAKEQTVFGLSGLGDLLATCYSPLSRNYQVGYRLGQGQNIDRILADLKVTAEGVQTARAVQMLAGQAGLEMPITDLVVAALDGHVVTPEQMVKSLMSRRLKSEQESELCHSFTV